MPTTVTDTIVSWYNRNKRVQGAGVEGFYPGYTTINFREVPTTMVSLDRDPATKDRLAEAILPIVEAWAGEPLRMTALYGVREYHNGSWLKLHVDHVSTHVYSVIINVAQEWAEGAEPAANGGEGDWPLEVIDFRGGHAAINMRPGQMLLYESAKLVHGTVPVPGSVLEYGRRPVDSLWRALGGRYSLPRPDNPRGSRFARPREGF
jgi:prolyl 4-hydroxylase